MVYGQFGVCWVMAGSLGDEIWAWRGICDCRKHVEIIPLTIFWMVWKERNKKAFDRVKDTDGFDILKNR